MIMTTTQRLIYVIMMIPNLKRTINLQIAIADTRKSVTSLSVAHSTWSMRDSL